MGNRWKGKISHAILKIFRTYNRIDVIKLPFLEELYEKTFVVPYVRFTAKFVVDVFFFYSKNSINDLTYACLSTHIYMYALII